MTPPALRHRQLAVLSALQRYGVLCGKQIQKIMDTEEGRFLQKPGSIYGTLGPLQDRGLIRLTLVTPQGRQRGGRPRKYYELTDAGYLAVQHNRALA